MAYCAVKQKCELHVLVKKNNVFLDIGLVACSCINYEHILNHWLS